MKSTRIALMLAVVVLLAGATTSFAQFAAGSAATFNVAASNPFVRDQGITETVGDITATAVLAGNGGATSLVVAPGSTPATATLSFNFNAAITNKSTAPGAGNLCTGAAAGGPTACTGAAGLVLNAAMPGATAGITVTTANFTGSAGSGATAGSIAINWQVSGSTLNVTFVLKPGTDAGAAGTTTLVFGASTAAAAGAPAANVTIHGVRVNASTIPTSSTGFATVNAFVLSSPSNILFLSGFFNPIVAGTVAPAVDLSKSSVNGGKTFTFAACTNPAAPTLPASPALPGTGKQSAAAGSQVDVKIAEGFVGSFTTNAQEAGKSAAAEVTNGTRVLISVSNLPTQASVAAVELTAVGAGGTQATLVNSVDATGANTGAATALVAGATLGKFDAVTASGGVANIVYEITTPNGSTAPDALTFNLLVFGANPDITAAASPITVTATLAPNVAAATQAKNGAPIVDFTPKTFSGTGSFTSCTTALLFPYIANKQGFDTGISIANAGQDDNGTSAQSGTCKLMYFDGSTTGKTPQKTSTLGPVVPGQTAVLVISADNPGFQGYLFARCNFQFAHGFAYVTYNVASTPGGPAGAPYLALIVPEPRGATTAAPEALGN